MSEREADLASPSWCFSSHGVSRQAQEHASSQIRHVDVFSAHRRQPPTRGFGAYAGSDAWSSMKVRRHQKWLRSRNRQTLFDRGHLYYDEATALTLRKGPRCPSLD